MRAALLVLLAGPALAGAWARDAGGLYLQLGSAVFVGDHRDDLVVDVDSAGGRFVGRAIELYAEVGVGAGFELALQTAWVDQAHEIDDAGDEHSTGIGDVEVLAKWSPTRGSTAIALLVGTRVAAYETLSLDERVDGEPARGPGGADLLFGFGWGHGFQTLPAWIGVDLLNRVRLGGSSAGATLRLEGGYRFGPAALAANFELQPAYGRTLDQPDDAPAPVPTAGALGGKLLVDLWGGAGLVAGALWSPESLNDGPGYRLSAGVSYAR